MAILWNAANDPLGNVQHIAKHNVTPAEVEQILLNPKYVATKSRSSGRPITFGRTTTGRKLAVVWVAVGTDVLPITAYDAP